MILAAALANWLSAAEFFQASANTKTTLGFWEALYVSVVTFTTVGYGDIAPADVFPRIVCCAEGIAGGIFLGLLAATAYKRIGK